MPRQLAGAPRRIGQLLQESLEQQAFVDGLSAGCLVAGGVALAGAIMAAWLLPAQPLPSPAQAAGKERKAALTEAPA